MRTELDCIPCMVRQALDASRLITDDPALHQTVVRRVLNMMAETELIESPPCVAEGMYALIAELTGNEDPYREVKERCNREMLEMAPRLRETIASADDPFGTALRIAVAGNIIDFGAMGDYRDEHLEEALTQCFGVEVDPATVQRLHDAIDAADSIL